MNKNVRIAKKLMKLAKSLIGFDGQDGLPVLDDDDIDNYSQNKIADKPGKYENFTGQIDWEGTKGKVKNAYFYLSDYSSCKIIFYEVTWIDGTWTDGAWENGNWKDGIWKEGLWKNGTWKNGIWENGHWNNGNWKDGTWENGTWWNGTWTDGTWENGIWYDGTWKNGRDKKIFHKQNDSPDKWL